MGTSCFLLAAVLLCQRGSLAQRLPSVRVYNFRRVDVELRWMDGTADGVFLATIPAMNDLSQDTFVGHSFLLVHRPAADSEPVVLKQLTMDSMQMQYAVEPDLDDAEALADPRYLRYVQSSESRRYRAELDELASNGALPEVATLQPGERKQDGFGLRLCNFRLFPVEVYWDDGSSPGVLQETLGAMPSEAIEITTYSGHAFRVMRRDNSTGKLEQVDRFVASADVLRYTLMPEPHDNAALEHPAYLKFLQEAAFEDEYFKTHGYRWLGQYPARPPSLSMHQPEEKLGEISAEVQLRPESLGGQKEDPASVSLISLSPGFPHGPRAFLIRNLLSPKECSHVAKTAEPHLSYSGVGADRRKSAIRTSQTAFLERKESRIIDLIHRRFADVLNVTDEQLNVAAEKLQIVRYEKGQEYQAHNDYSSFAQRLATLLIYLDVPEEGGGTSFPKAFGGLGFQVKPEQGSAILFYSQLPDGNLDELAQHAGLPVSVGVKRVCNLWLHSHAERPWQQERNEL